MNLPHRRNVLITEDDYLIAIDIERALKVHGFQATEIVGNCSEAIDRVEAGTFDLVTVDVDLGDDTCEHLVEMLRRRRIPFIYISGFVKGDHPSLPAAPWLVKPVNDEELLTAVQSVCGPDCSLPRRASSN